jgi:5-hydroxyisourate hydrolase
VKADLSTHVLDAVSGTPAVGVQVTLLDAAGTSRAAARTDADGRVAQLASGLEPGTYRVRFDTAGYFAARATATLYPEVVVAIEIGSGGHFHVPLLLSPFAYSTYRGS